MEPKDQATKDERAEKGAPPDPMNRGMGMMNKMMSQMGKGGFNPMEMMQKMMSGMGEGQQQGEAMPPMMQMCMGMCSEMLTAMKRTTDMAAFATPELHPLFTEWLGNLESEALRLIKENGEMDAAAIGEALKISEASASLLIARLAGEGKLHCRAQIITENE